MSSAPTHGWLEGHRQHQASEDHSVIILVSGPQEHIYLLPKEPDEKVARLRLFALDAELTVFAVEQPDYTGP